MKDLTKIKIGREGEQMAAEYLKKNGYKICEINFRCPLGEIDVIARDKKELVFIEVKTRKPNDLGYPEQAVGPKKQKKLSLLASWYLQQNNLEGRSARFDVVAITVLPQGNEIRLIKNAFDFIP